MKRILLSLLTVTSYTLSSQVYSDYLGAGHNQGITVTSSSQQSRNQWNETANGNNTINGSGLDARLLETSRFLAQATFGTTLEYIMQVSEQSFEDWIDAQFDIDSPPLTISVENIYNQARDLFVANGGNFNDYFGPEYSHFQYAWWQSNIGNEDLLRQRIALALSQVLVVSGNGSIGDYGIGMANYYDVLKDNAFGNFRDLLLEVTLHPIMGSYLSHYNNPRSNPEYNIHPDENYAREVMQLFSIGLYELNQDGTYQLDGNGDRIPTYDNDDIKEFAKIFTGLGPGAIFDNPYHESADFGIGFYFARKNLPMTMYDEWHEPGPKYLLNGQVVPAGQSGMQDIEDAIDNLFNHPNTAPFIALRLIQQLVKSNPSPEYIGRVSAAFNNTNGARGDMRAVIKAILLDEEARSCAWISNPTHGKLIEPMLRYFNVVRQIDLDSPDGYFWNNGYFFYESTGQLPLTAPHVFNFYPPDYVPNNEFDDANLVGPEYQIHNSATSLAFINMADFWTSPTYFTVFNTWNLGIEDAKLDFEALKYYAKDSEVLVNQLDKLFTRGQLSTETKELIVEAVDPIGGSNPNIDYLGYRVKMAIYLIIVSPDYAILK